MPPVLFAPWTPDEPALGNGALEALGVIGEKAGYRPLKSLATATSALAARAQGAVWFRAPGGTTAQFAGDATRLYKLDNATWDDVSRLVGGAYGLGGDGSWRFAQFGPLAYATNGVDALQSFDMGPGTNFIDAAGSPPVGTFIGTVRRFLVLAKLGSNNQRVHWSGENNPATWASSATTLADFQDLPDGGDITGFVGGQFGLVFQETAVTRMTFEGSPTVFRFDKIGEDIGATIAGCVVGYGGIAFFCHRSGFFMVRAGQEIVPIGRDKVDRWFWEQLDQSAMHRVTAAFDPVNSLYIVSFPSNGSSGTPNAMLIYNLTADRWTHADVVCEMIYSGATQQSYTLEDLDAFGTLDTLPYPLDSAYWMGSRQLLLSGFATDHKSGAFSGANMAATIDTGESQPSDGRRSRIRNVRPLFDGGSPSISVGTRQTQQGAVVWSAARSMTSDGRVPLNVSGRYCRFRAVQPAGETWSWAQGLDELDIRPAGFR
jgi:hypothetical protein